MNVIFFKVTHIKSLRKRVDSFVGWKKVLLIRNHLAEFDVNQKHLDMFSHGLLKSDANFDSSFGEYLYRLKNACEEKIHESLFPENY